MKCSIYIIKNTINNKMYIGQTWQKLNQRFNEHKSTNKCIHLFNAMNKYGRKNFSIELIAECSNQEVADYLEITYIAEYDSVKNGYNLSLGGQGHRTVSDATRLKMSLSGKGKAKRGSGWNQTQDTKDKISLAKTGKSHIGTLHTKEAKNKISLSRMGKPTTSKLDLNIANLIRKDYNTNNFTQKELAIKYNISTAQIYRVLHNKVWVI